jgi:hypothetical protein
VIHHATADFWKCYHALPEEVQRLPDRGFALLKSNPRHPALQFKKIDRFWSARVGLHYRVLGVAATDGILWLWIGSHAEYDRLIQ